MGKSGHHSENDMCRQFCLCAASVFTCASPGSIYNHARSSASSGHEQDSPYLRSCPSGASLRDRRVPLATPSDREYSERFGTESDRTRAIRLVMQGVASIEVKLRQSRFMAPQ